MKRAENTSSGALLLAAVVDGQSEEVRRLLEGEGADPNASNRHGNTALTLAASNGLASCLALLIRAGADPDAVDGRHVPAISSACAAGHVECVRLLLAAAADANQSSPRGRTALHHACRNTHSKPCVEALLSSTSTAIDKADFEGFTALHMACKNGHVDAAAQLLRAGANVELQARGQTALTLARLAAAHESQSATARGGPPRLVRPTGASRLVELLQRQQHVGAGEI
jgi:ankyrin repeat protein